METEEERPISSLEYLNSKVCGDQASFLDDLDQVPFSIFMDQQAQRDHVHEWVIEEFRHCTKIVVSYDGGTNYNVWAVTRFGTFNIGNASLVSFNPFSLFGSLFQAVSDGTYFLKYPEFVLIEDEKPASQAASETWVNSYTVTYYRDLGYPLGHPIFSCIDTNYAVCTNIDIFIERYQGRVYEAARMLNIFTTPVKYSAAALFSAPKLVQDAQKEDQITGEYSAWSQASWPEIQGLATRYIDNVGVFLPDYLDVDYNLSHSLGSKLIASYFIRPPSTTDESTMFNVQSLRSMLEFLFAGQGAAHYGTEMGTSWDRASQTFSNSSSPTAGGMAQGIINTYNFGMGLLEKWLQRVRVVLPRIRAFGRQNEPVLSHDNYFNAVKQVAGTDGWNDYQGYKNKLWETKVLVLIKSEPYAQFVNSLREYITSRGGKIE